MDTEQPGLHQVILTSLLVIWIILIIPVFMLESGTLESNDNQAAPIDTKNWQDLWDKVNNYMETDNLEQLDPELATLMDNENKPIDARVYPSADTYFMRHPNKRQSIDYNLLQRLQAVKMATSAEQRLSLINSLEEKLTQPFAQYWLGLQKAKIKVKQKDIDLSSIDLNPLYQIAQPEWQADLLWLDAYIHYQQGQYLTAQRLLNQALSLDPIFLHGLKLQLEVVYENAYKEQYFQNTQDCLDTLTQLLDINNKIAVLIQDPQEFLKLSEELAHLSSHSLKYFLIAYNKHLGGQQALQNFQLVVNDNKNIDLQCHQQILNKIQWILNQ